LDGVRNKIEPAVPFEGNIYSAEGLQQIPTSLDEAVRRMQKAITEALAEFDLDITRAMVTTLGHDIVDVFYVDSDGLDLGSDRMKRELRLALLHAIDSQ